MEADLLVRVYGGAYYQHFQKSHYRYYVWAISEVNSLKCIMEEVMKHIATQERLTADIRNLLVFLDRHG